jgi:hypothetical protein
MPTADCCEKSSICRTSDAALFLVPAHTYVVVISAPVTQFVNERSIGMEVEDDRLVCGEERIEILCVCLRRYHRLIDSSRSFWLNEK